MEKELSNLRTPGEMAAFQAGYEAGWEHAEIRADTLTWLALSAFVLGLVIGYMWRLAV